MRGRGEAQTRESAFLLAAQIMSIIGMVDKDSVIAST